MGFQPFGYHFHVELPLQSANAKAAINRRLKPWFEQKKGARGWILGPFICLWLNAFDRHGPMLFGTIRSHNFGTRVSGRAGSDLNGLAWFVGLALLLIAISTSEMLSGEANGGSLLVFGLFLLFLPLMLWMSHKDRRQAEPLVRFLEETVTGQRPKRRLEFDYVAVSAGLKLDVDGEMLEQSFTAQRVAEALQSIEDDGFMVVSSADDIYIQTAADSGSFVIEKRDGAADSHMEAVRSDAPDSKWLKRTFTFEETLATLLAYASGGPTPEVVEWRPMF